MNLTRRAKPWAVAAALYAVPNLPGKWVVLDDVLIVHPVGLIAQGVGAQPNSLVTLLHPLYMPIDYVDTGWMLAHDNRIPGRFPRFKAAEDGKEYMERLVNVVRRNALPFFKEHGTLEGYLGWCRKVNSGLQNGLGDPHILYRQAATAIVLQHFAEAARALDAIEQIGSNEPTLPQWFRTLSQQANTLRSRLAADPATMRETLLVGAAEQRERRRLPKTDD